MSFYLRLRYLYLYIVLLIHDTFLTHRTLKNNYPLNYQYLKSLTINSDCDYYEAEPICLELESLESINIIHCQDNPSVVFFFECPNLKEVHLSSEVKELEYVCLTNRKYFWDCSLSNINIYATKNLKRVFNKDPIYKLYANLIFDDGMCENFYCNMNSVNIIVNGSKYESHYITQDMMDRGITNIPTAAIKNIYYECSVDSSFEIYFADFKNLEEIVLPDGLTTIPEYCFSRCISLKNVVIPNSVTRIELGAFARCEALESIELPNGLEYIGRVAFSECFSLDNINIPNRTIELSDHIFYGCSSLRNITIPNGITELSNYIFSNCRNLRNITLPNSLLNIGDGCFSATELNRSL